MDVFLLLLLLLLLGTKRGERKTKYAVIRAFREVALSIAGFPFSDRYFADSNWKFKLLRVLAAGKTDACGPWKTRQRRTTTCYTNTRVGTSLCLLAAYASISAQSSCVETDVPWGWLYCTNNVSIETHVWRDITWRKILNRAWGFVESGWKIWIVRSGRI